MYYVDYKQNVIQLRYLLLNVIPSIKIKPTQIRASSCVNFYFDLVWWTHSWRYSKHSTYTPYVRRFLLYWSIWKRGTHATKLWLPI